MPALPMAATSIQQILWFYVIIGDTGLQYLSPLFSLTEYPYFS